MPRDGNCLMSAMGWKADIDPILTKGSRIAHDTHAIDVESFPKEVRAAFCKETGKLCDAN